MLYFTVPLSRFLSCQTQMQRAQVKGGAFHTPTFPPAPDSVVQKMQTHPHSEITCVRDKYLQPGVETLAHT